jgi:YD repeat-containing protein
MALLRGKAVAFVALGAVWSVLILGSSSAIADTTGYTYDSQGRIATATYTNSSGTFLVTYNYDVAGNFTSVTTVKQ